VSKEPGAVQAQSQSDLQRGSRTERQGKPAQSEGPEAWEDKFKRLLLRFESIQQRHYGMKLMAYTLVNLRHFCDA